MKYKILLIEDDKFLAGMYVKKIEAEKVFDVSFALSGEEGLEAIKKQKPDLVLLDIMLPGINGFDLLKKLREDQATQELPVIMLTNLNEKEDIQKALSLGANDYLIKAHFMPSEVIAKMRRVLAG